MITLTPIAPITIGQLPTDNLQHNKVTFINLLGIFSSIIFSKHCNVSIFLLGCGVSFHCAMSLMSYIIARIPSNINTSFVGCSSSTSCTCKKG